MNTLNLSDKSWKRSASKGSAQRGVGHVQVAEQGSEPGFMSRTNAAEERLREVSLALAAVEARVGALVEDFRGQIEGTVQAFQGKSSRQAKDLEKVAQLLGERWFRQFQEQAEAGLEKLREELKKSMKVAEETKQQLTTLADEKLGPLGKAAQEEYGLQLAEALREHAQVMHEPAKVELESIKQAAEQTFAQLEAAEKKRDADFAAQAGAVEERLKGVSSAVEALEGRVGSLVGDFQGRIESTLQTFQGKGAKQAEDLEKAAQDLGGRWSQQFREQAEAAVEKLREEVKNSVRAVEESKQQLASMAEAKLASLTQTVREEYSQQLAQTIREHALATHEPTNGDAESFKQAAQQAIAQLEAAEHKREASFLAQAEATEQRLKGVSSAVEALEGRMEATVQTFQGTGTKQAEDLEKIAQDVGGRWSQRLQEQTDAAVAKLQADEQKREADFLAQAQAAEERLKGVSSAVETLDGRIASLVGDFQGRMEGALQTFQWKGARQAEDLEKIVRDVGGRWTQQFQEQAEAALGKLGEEIKNSLHVAEEGKQQLTSLAEAKLASLSKAAQEEHSQQLAKTIREHAQVTHELTTGEIESLDQAAKKAIAQLEVADRKKQASFLAQTEAAEKRLRGVCTVAEALEGRVGTLVEDFRGRMESTLQAFQAKSTKQAEELGKVAQDVGGRWSQQLHEQAEAAVEKVREEARNSVRVVEESRHQLANLAKSKLAVLNQVADNAAADFEEEQKRLKNEFEVSRRELEDRIEKGWTGLPSPSFPRGSSLRRRGTLTQLGIVAAVCLVLMLPLLGVYLSIRTVMRLQADPPSDFIDQFASLNLKRRVPEVVIAQAYWQVAEASLQEKYPFGSQLPADPPNEFQVDSKYIPPKGAKPFSESRTRYWDKLRKIWVQRECWEEHHEWNTQWLTRLRGIWGRLPFLIKAKGKV